MVFICWVVISLLKITRRNVMQHSSIRPLKRSGSKSTKCARHVPKHNSLCKRAHTKGTSKNNETFKGMRKTVAIMYETRLIIRWGIVMSSFVFVHIANCSCYRCPLFCYIDCKSNIHRWVWLKGEEVQYLFSFIYWQPQNK